MLQDINFTKPIYFWLFLVFIPMIIWYILKKKDEKPKYQISSVLPFGEKAKSLRFYFRHIIFVLRLLVLSLLIIAMARPKKIIKEGSFTTEGISIAMAIDISGSMLAQDFDPDRLEAAKSEAINFISGRPNDRIAVVAFAGETFTQCPLTTDHAAVVNLLRQLKTGLIEDGTAIGLGLANAVARLKDDNAKSKIIILLTDGVNNRGEIAPITAAEIAKTLGIRVYTIGVGKNGYAPYPVQTDFGVQIQQVEVEIDEKLLQEISSLTGGQYFRATNGEKLSEIYTQIDKLEKTIFEKDEQVQYKDYFLPFIIFALIFLMLEIILNNTVFRTIP